MISPSSGRAVLAALISAAACTRSGSAGDVTHAQQCDTAADCCPGQKCHLSYHYCVDDYDGCSTGFCPTPGQVCKTIGVFSSGPGCTWNKCGSGGSCGAGTSCFNSYCVGEAPCHGGCGAGRVCITATNRCSPAPRDASCQQTCPAGKMLALSDADNIFDTCKPASEKCECDSLPPIPARDVARHSSIAASGPYLYVSAYDGEHGDLVLHTFDRSALDKPLKSEWLDGVPGSGHIGGDVNGPRGGITDPGPNVGLYSSAAVNAAGDLLIAYYDVDNGDLKFIARYAGKWTAPMTIDGSTPSGTPSGDAGMYASLAIGKSGIPAIAYFRRGSYDASKGNESGPSTALVYAAAKKPQPLTRDDWTVVGDVEQADRPASPGLTELPPGTGLMPSLGFIEDHPVIAYYDSIKRAVKAVMGSGAGAAPGFGAPVEIDGHDTSPLQRDTGRWPALAIGPAGSSGGRIAIAFADLTRQQLLLYQSDGLVAHVAHDGPGLPGLIHAVDDGRPDAGAPWHAQGFPGSQSSIGFTSSGKIALAYQDAAPVDLMFATWDPAQNKTISRTTLRAAGSAGFWPRLTIVNGIAYVSSATLRAATAQIPANQLFVDARPTP